MRRTLLAKSVNGRKQLTKKNKKAEMSRIFQAIIKKNYQTTSISQSGIQQRGNGKNLYGTTGTMVSTITTHKENACTKSFKIENEN